MGTSLHPDARPWAPELGSKKTSLNFATDVLPEDLLCARQYSKPSPTVPLETKSVLCGRTAKPCACQARAPSQSLSPVPSSCALKHACSRPHIPLAMGNCHQLD